MTGGGQPCYSCLGRQHPTNPAIFDTFVVKSSTGPRCDGTRWAGSDGEVAKGRTIVSCFGQSIVSVAF